MYGVYSQQSGGGVPTLIEKVYTTNDTLVLPSGAYDITLMCLGGAGGGSRYKTNVNFQSGGNGGNGSDYTESFYATLSGTLSIFIGAGGPASSNQYNEPGGSSYIALSGSTIIRAKGGNSGDTNIYNSKLYTGGAGGVGNSNIAGCAGYGGSSAGMTSNGYAGGAGGAGGVSKCYGTLPTYPTPSLQYEHKGGYGGWNGSNGTRGQNGVAKITYWIDL